MIFDSTACINCNNWKITVDGGASLHCAPTQQFFIPQKISKITPTHTMENLHKNTLELDFQWPKWGSLGHKEMPESDNESGLWLFLLSFESSSQPNSFLRLFFHQWTKRSKCVQLWTIKYLHINVEPYIIMQFKCRQDGKYGNNNDSESRPNGPSLR